MINKLLDEPYWDEINKVKDIFHPSGEFVPFTNSSGLDAQKILILNFVDAVMVYLEHPGTTAISFYNYKKAFPEMEKFIDTEGFHLIKEDISFRFMDYFKRTIIHNPQNHESQVRELEMVKEFLNNTHNIQEILEVFQLYVLFIKTYSKQKTIFETQGI